jgi:hypothetical protein
MVTAVGGVLAAILTAIGALVVAVVLAKGEIRKDAEAARQLTMDTAKAAADAAAAQTAIQKASVAAVATTVREVHEYVNARDTSLLKQIAVLESFVAALTKDPGDRRSARAAARNVAVKEAVTATLAADRMAADRKAAVPVPPPPAPAPSAGTAAP